MLLLWASSGKAASGAGRWDCLPAFSGQSLRLGVAICDVLCLCSGVAIILAAYRDKDDSLNYLGAGGTFYGGLLLLHTNHTL